MKLTLILAAVLGLGLAAPKAPRAESALYEDLVELIDLIDVDNVLKVVDEHVADDAAVDAVVVYLQGDDWQKLVAEVLALPAAEDFVDYLNDAGIPVEDIIKDIHDYIASGEPGVEPDDTASLRSFLDDVEEYIPGQKILQFVVDKLQSAEEVQDLYTEISSEDAFDLVETVRDIDEVQRLAEKLRGMDVDIDNILKTVYDFLGWEYKPHDSGKALRAK